MAIIDLTGKTVQDVKKGAYANCVVKDILEDGRVEVWNGGIVCLIVGEKEHGSYGKIPLLCMRG